MTPEWHVLVIGGASGSGKTMASYPLAEHFGVPLVEIDDLVHALVAITTPEQLPHLHGWRSHPDPARPVADAVHARVRLAETLRPAVEAVVLNHIAARAPVIVEGDYLLPSLLSIDGVRGVFLHEHDEDHIVRNYLRREPERGWQPGRAAVSRRYGDWLAAQASVRRLPVLPSRPWATLVTRILYAIGPPGTMLS